MTAARTCPCIVKYSPAGVLQWVQDVGYEPKEIAVDDVDKVYVKLSGLSGSQSTLNQTTGAIVSTNAIRPGLGRRLAHPSDLSGTFQLANYGPGADALTVSTDVALVGDSNNYVANAGHWASNASKAYIYISGTASGVYSSAGTRRFGFTYATGKTISPIADVWIDDNGNAYVIGQKSGDSTLGYVYKYDATTGARLWQVDVRGAYVAVTGDNSGYIYIAGGDYFDGSNILKLNDSDGSVVWGTDTGADIFDIAVDAGGNVVGVGRVGTGSDNIYYLDSTGTIVWTNHNHPHNPTFSGEAWAACFDAAGNVYATGRRICN